MKKTKGKEIRDLDKTSDEVIRFAAWGSLGEFLRLACSQYEGHKFLLALTALSLPNSTAIHSRHWSSLRSEFHSAYLYHQTSTFNDTSFSELRQLLTSHREYGRSSPEKIVTMAEVTNGRATTLDSTIHIPIAQLTPILSAPSTRSIKAVVTLTWPYSSATKSVAFLLSEPDFRLRRTRGQVRVQFSGSSAKSIAKSGIASGDEVLLGLEGVEWVHDEGTVTTPGRGVEFELRFTERLLLQVRSQKG